MTTNTSSALLALADDLRQMQKNFQNSIAPHDPVIVDRVDQLREWERAARSAATAEPVAWRWRGIHSTGAFSYSETKPDHHPDYPTDPLYASPPSSGEPQSVVAGEREEAIQLTRDMDLDELALAYVRLRNTRQQGPDEAAIRAQVIEECAKVADAHQTLANSGKIAARLIAETIRALAHQPVTERRFGPKEWPKSVIDRAYQYQPGDESAAPAPAQRTRPTND